MADQFNSNTPNMANLVLSDVTWMKETAEFFRDVFQNFLNDWSNTVSANKYPATLADADIDTKIYYNDSKWKFACAGTDQIYIENGAIKPTTDNDIDLGSATLQFKDIFIDGIANIDMVEGDTYDIEGTYYTTIPTNGVGASGIFMVGTSSAIVWFYLNTAPPGWKVLATGADTVCGVSGGSQSYNVNGGAADSSATWTISGLSQNHYHSLDIKGESSGSGCYGNGAFPYTTATASAISSSGAWRPAASVGKLFQLDTA